MPKRLPLTYIMRAVPVVTDSTVSAESKYDLDLRNS
jgi:hypothetical protein